MHRADAASLPLPTIHSYARHAATGQLSWTSEDLSATVYLERGRIAWATSSLGTFSFGREITKHAQVDVAELRAILERCRRERRPFGEALVRAGIASVETVRALLRAQVEDALATLVGVVTAPAAFVPRHPAGLAYDEALTFAFDEVVPSARRRDRKVTESFSPPAPGGVRTEPRRNEPMATLKDTLAKVMEIDGALGCCAVDSNSGMMLGSAGGGPVNLEVAAAGNTEVVRAKRKTMRALGLADAIDDILITLGRQYHIIRPLASNDALFVYLVLDKSRGNLAMARHQLSALERELSI